MSHLGHQYGRVWCQWCINEAFSPEKSCHRMVCATPGERHDCCCHAMPNTIQHCAESTGKPHLFLVVQRHMEGWRGVPPLWQLVLLSLGGTLLAGDADLHCGALSRYVTLLGCCQVIALPHRGCCLPFWNKYLGAAQQSMRKCTMRVHSQGPRAHTDALDADQEPAVCRMMPVS